MTFLKSQAIEHIIAEKLKLGSETNFRKPGAGVEGRGCVGVSGVSLRRQVGARAFEAVPRGPLAGVGTAEKGPRGNLFASTWETHLVFGGLDPFRMSKSFLTY